MLAVDAELTASSEITKVKGNRKVRQRENYSGGPDHFPGTGFQWRTYKEVDIWFELPHTLVDFRSF